MLTIQNFLHEHPDDWEALLKRAPYHLTIKRKCGYVIFSYGQFDSDMSLPLVQECRGIILREGTWEVVAHTFDKFFNVGEVNAADIDWGTARVQEKIDGSLIKVWNADDGWHISSNNMIDAFDIPVIDCAAGQLSGVCFESFGDLFIHTLRRSGHANLLQTLNKDYCYMFEVVSPYNRVVVEWERPEVFHIGTRDMRTQEELNVDCGVQKPREFNLHSLEETLAAAEVLPENNERYVVVDAQWHRVKIKSPRYVLNFHLRTGTLGLKKLFNVWMSGQNEVDELLAYFPKYKETFNNIEAAFVCLVEQADYDWSVANNSGKDCDAKEFAALVKKMETPWEKLIFRRRKGEVIDTREYVRNMLGLYDKIKQTIKAIKGVVLEDEEGE